MLVVKGISDSVAITRILDDGATKYVGNINVNDFSADVKKHGEGIDFKNKNKVLTGCLWGDGMINDVVITKDNATNLVKDLIKACSGGGGGSEGDFITQEELDEQLSNYIFNGNNEKPIIITSESFEIESDEIHLTTSDGNANFSLNEDGANININGEDAKFTINGNEPLYHDTSTEDEIMLKSDEFVQLSTEDSVITIHSNSVDIDSENLNYNGSPILTEYRGIYLDDNNNLNISANDVIIDSQDAVTIRNGSDNITMQNGNVSIFATNDLLIGSVDNNIIANGNIILENDKKLLGKATDGTQYNLAEISRFTDLNHPIADFGSASAHFNINCHSDHRPTIQLNGESGEESHEIAFRSEGVTVIPQSFFNPSLNSDGTLTMPEITFSDIQKIYVGYSGGNKLDAYFAFVESINAFSIDEDIAIFEYSFDRIIDGNIVRANVQVSGTDQSLITRGTYVSYPLTALSVNNAVSGALNTEGAIVEYAIPGTICIISIEYKTNSTAQVRVRTSQSNMAMSIYRTSVYNGVSEGASFDSQNIDSTGTIVDDTVYVESNDRVRLDISIGLQWYIAELWTVRSGATAFIKCDRII